MHSRPTFADDLLPRAAAAIATAAILLLALRVLWQGPTRGDAAGVEGDRLSLRFVARSPSMPVEPAVAQDAPARSAPAGPDASAPPSPPRSGAAAATSASTAAPQAPGHATVLYDDDGRVRLPDGSEARAPGSQAARDAEAARRLMERENPVDYRGTRFAKDWVSDGDVADVAEQGIARAQKKIARLIFGPDVQHAEARPSPDVRFNPGRHERPSDLGSEATGDAYKAAPINYEKAPGLDGEASRRIRAQVAALEAGHAGCDQARLRTLMEPVTRHLDDLQRAEAAYARGADPVRAEHMLPNQANTAYDMARRALWHAERRLLDCRR